MKEIKRIIKEHDAFDINAKYQVATPVPNCTIDNFLSEDFAQRMYEESNTIPEEYWTKFTRNGSNMEECIRLDKAPVATEFVNQMHSSLGMEWISHLTGVDNIIADPYIVGAGYSKSYKGDSLKIHTDFNWNDRLQVHRVASLIVYLTPGWKPEWKGTFEYWDENREHKVKEVDCLFNRCIIWNYHKRGFHGYPEPIECPEGEHRTTFRLMFYVSNAEYNKTDRPHRSLYWYDKDMDEPYDIPSQK